MDHDEHLAHKGAQARAEARARARARARAMLAQARPPWLRATGWWPWLPLDARDLAMSPYGFSQVEIAREEWATPQCVDPRSLHPQTNVVGLWWRPVEDTRPDAQEEPYA